MAGYSWNHGKSNNAVAAEQDGKMVATAAAKWARQALGVRSCTPADIRCAVAPAEWHHTSKRFNRVDYYDAVEIEEARDELIEAVAARKRNAKSGLGADVRYPLTELADGWLVVELQNGEVAAARHEAFGDWAEVRALSDEEYAAAAAVWPYVGRRPRAH